ncbi:c-opsin [Sarotherodon galilaeus]
MYPLLLLLLLLLGGRSSESTAPVPYDNVGQNFTVVFPENIASYYPSPPTNMVKITALKDGTTVKLQQYGNPEHQDLDAGDVWNFTANATLELGKQNISSNTLTINSNKDITVQAISLKQDSLQTAVVIPTDKLSTTYLIPPIPTIPGTNNPQDLVVQTVTERGPFRIIIVNGVQEQNKVTVEGLKTQEVSLQSGQVAQIWLEEGAGYKNVTAEKPVAVLFGHPCAILGNCSCGLLYTILPPAPGRTLKYLVPPLLAKDAEGETRVLLAQNGSTSVKPYDSSSLMYDVAGTAILYRPGLLLPLIPTANFACCFVVTAFPTFTNNYAVIVVSSNVTDGVRVGKDRISSADWKKLGGTNYSSIQVTLSLGKTVIWHTSSKMAVYFQGNNGSTLIGNQAPVISSSPDFRGCVVTPEVVDLEEQPNGWRESFKNCADSDLELLCLSSTDLQKQIYGKLNQYSNAIQEVWIGMRRSSLNGQWYWVNGDSVNSTNWGDGKPGGVEEGQCTIMSLGNGTGFQWSDDDCCKDAHYICYKEPELFPI